MVEACDMGIAFWDGKSRGTRDSIRKLVNANKLLRIVYIEWNRMEINRK